MFSSISQSFRVSGCKKNANLFIEDIERNLESMNVVIPPKGDINIKDSNDTRVIFETDFGADGIKPHSPARAKKDLVKIAYYLLSLSEELEFRDNVGAEFAQGSNDETECFTQYDYCCKVKGNSKNYEDIRNMIKAYIFNEVGSYWIYSFIDISTYRDNFRQKIYIKKEKEECVCVMTNIEHEKMGNIKLEMNIWLKCDAKQDRVRKMDVKITSKSDYIGDFGREMSELLKDVCMMHHFPIKLLYFKKENGSGEVDSEAKQIVNCLY